MIVAVPPQTLTHSQKELLNKKGYVVIETNDPDKIRVIYPESPVEVNDFLMSALLALSRADVVVANSYFIKELYRRLSNNETRNHNSQQQVG